jgi:hypothetical protein
MTKPAVTLSLTVLGLALAGCGGGNAGGSLLPSPVVVANAPRLSVHGARLLSPRRLAFDTSGSSSCPNVPATLVIQNPHSIRVNMKAATPSDGICTADLLISPVAIAINPKEIDVHQPLKVSLYYPLAKQPVVFTAPPL